MVPAHRDRGGSLPPPERSANGATGPGCWSPPRIRRSSMKSSSRSSAGRSRFPRALGRLLALPQHMRGSAADARGGGRGTRMSDFRIEPQWIAAGAALLCCWRAALMSGLRAYQRRARAQGAAGAAGTGRLRGGASGAGARRHGRIHSHRSFAADAARNSGARHPPRRGADLRRRSDERLDRHGPRPPLHLR